MRAGARAERRARRLPARARVALRAVARRAGGSLLDCANGATYRAAPLLFERLGAEVDVIGREPDGVNINAGCGSTHMDALVRADARGRPRHRLRVRRRRRPRCWPSTGDGRVVDGDEIIAQVALDLKRRGELAGNGVAVTVMTNFGFHTAMREAGIEVATTDVGDRHVVEELSDRGWVLGGEQSGHIIDMRLTPSGDGIAAALLLLAGARGAAARAAARR